MLSPELIRKLRDDSNFAVFQEFILDKIDELNTVDGLLDMSNEDAGEKAKIRAQSAALLKTILAPFIDFKEKREPTTEEIQAVKNRAGL